MKIMSHLFPVILIMFATGCDQSTTTPEDVEAGYLVINEFLASNDTTNTDEYGEFDDWVELFNGKSTPVDIGGMYISDAADDLTPWQIPANDAMSTTIDAGGFLILWCDKQPEQGTLHVDIKLSNEGESIILWESDATTLVDSLSFGPINAGISMGRLLDGGNTWGTFSTPTPGASNQISSFK
ncbi:MAG: lamin tail domain-containing protein [Candidatus Marinimicrobia bacterium]|nr:lamin tail domain-containing protein [Candidatus Neomarinimicrobiota bacterium]